MFLFCDPVRETFNIIYLAFSLLLFLVICFIVVVFSRNLYVHSTQKNRSIKAWRLSACLAFTMFTLIIITLITYVTWVVTLCVNKLQKYSDILQIMAYIFYTTQCLAFLLLLFIRIKHSFQTTPRLRLSKMTTIFWISNFMFAFILSSGIVISKLWIKGMVVGHLDLWPLLLNLAFLSYILLVVALSILFIRKLYQTHKLFQKVYQDRKCIVLITKVTVLNFISLFVTMLNAAVTTWNDSIILEFMNHYTCLFDIFTNLLCVVLSYNFYEKRYFQTLGCVHNICDLCCSKLMNDETKMIQNVQMENGSMSTNPVKRTQSVTMETVATTTDPETKTERKTNEPQVPSLKNANSLSVSLVENDVVKDGNVDFTVSIGDQQAVIH